MLFRSPTTGLHFADIEKLLEVLQRLVDGMVAGTWTQTRGKLELQPFGKLAARDRRALEQEAERLPD